MANVSVIKKIASKTKMGTYDVNDIVPQLNEIDPGWQVDIRALAMPMRQGSLTSVSREDFIEKFKVSNADLAGFSPTQASFSYLYGPASLMSGFSVKNAREERPSDEELASTTKEFLKAILKDVIVEKNPANPVVDQKYIASITKPKVEEQTAFQLDYSGRVKLLLVTVSIAGVKIGKEAFVVTAPNGKTVALEQKDSPSLWSFLYKETDVADKAKEFLASGSGSDAIQKQEREKTLRKFSANDNIGTCAICQSVQKLSKRESLVLHGYQRPGYGWIQGSCFGVDHLPWEVSPEGLEAYATYIKQSIPTQQRLVATGPTITSLTGYLWDNANFVWKKYKVSEDGFELIDDKPRKSIELSSDDKLYAESMDADGARKVIAKRKEKLIAEAKMTLLQMQQAKEDAERRVSQWKPTPLPGKPSVSGSMADVAKTLRHVAGLLSRT